MKQFWHAIGLSLVLVLPCSPGDAQVASAQEAFNRVRVQQDELNAQWAQDDFNEEQTRTFEPPRRQYPNGSYRNLLVHHVGNFEIAKLLIEDGKPLNAKQTREWQKKYDRESSFLTAHPRQTTEGADSSIISSAIASILLRVLKPVQMKVETGENGASLLVFTVLTDHANWEEFSGANVTEALSGEVRADAVNFTLHSITLKSSKGDTSNGALYQIDRGTSLSYSQSAKSGSVFPEIYEVELRSRAEFGHWTKIHTVVKFSNFSIVQP